MCTCPGCAASSGSPRRSPATCIRCGGWACGWTRPPGRGPADAAAAGPPGRRGHGHGAGCLRGPAGHHGPAAHRRPGRRRCHGRGALGGRAGGDKHQHALGTAGDPGGRATSHRVPARPAPAWRASGPYPGREAGGWEILVAVQGLTGGPAVIRTFVSNAELSRGVTGAWLVLAGLGVILLGLGVAVADRLVGTVTLPIAELARVSHVLAAGDLEARASLAGPPEVREVAGGLNHLAGRIRDLIWQERERVAGLGLDIARQTAEVSGGSLTIKPGNGGHVVVELGPPQSALEPR